MIFLPFSWKIQEHEALKEDKYQLVVVATFLDTKEVYLKKIFF